MADYYNPETDIQSFFQTKGGNQNGVSSSALLVLLRAKIWTPINGKVRQEASDQDPTVTDIIVSGGTATVTNGVQKNILVGAGIRSVSLDQQINVSVEQSLGFFDIVETLEHNVASNTLSIQKMMLRPLQLAKIGVAPFGLDVIRSPLLDCLITDGRLMAASGRNDAKGKNFTMNFARLDGLHIQSNRLSSNVGSTVQEDVTFRFDRILPFNDGADAADLMQQMRTRFPKMYQNFEWEQVNIDNMKKNSSVTFTK